MSNSGINTGLGDDNENNLVVEYILKKYQLHFGHLKSDYNVENDSNNVWVFK